MTTILLQTARRSSRGFTTVLRHWGLFGLFTLAIVDGLPLPTFGGPDILTAILAARHHEPWYVYAAVATAGSLIGAYITFHLARRAGIAYLQSKFKGARVEAALRLFERWGAGALAASAAVPIPTPTSLFFAAAGASKYPTRRFLLVVGLCRAVRYSLIALLAAHYGRHFLLVMRHPAQYWGWLLLLAAIVAAMVASGLVINRRLEAAAGAN